MGGRAVSSLPSAWVLAGALAVGWLGGGVSAWVLLRARRKAPRAVEEGAGPEEPATILFAADPVVSPPEPELTAAPKPVPAPERRLLELSDEDIDALPAELPAAEHGQRRKLPAPRKPVLRNI